MTPAEFKTIREHLGLPAKWLAERLGVSLRTVQLWEADNGVEREVPERAAVFLKKAELEIERLYFEDAAGIEAARIQHNQLVLTRYTSEEAWHAADQRFALFPLGVHAVLVARLRVQAEDAGVPVRIEYAAHEPVGTGASESDSLQHVVP